jgi:hypothetical protein
MNFTLETKEIHFKRKFYEQFQSLSVFFGSSLDFNPSILFNTSNQNGEPSEAALPVIKIPNILKTYPCSSYGLVFSFQPMAGTTLPVLEQGI